MTHYTPVRAATHTTYRPTGPDAFDCVTVSFVRDGSAHVFSEFGRERIRLGDAVLPWPNTLLGNEPDEAVTMTTVYIDRDFLVDQVFWRNARQLTDRMQAYDLMASRRVDAAQVVHLAPDRVGHLSPWLDELLLHGIMSTIAEFYSRNLASEVVKGMTQKATNGGTVGKAPIGYLNVRTRDAQGREVRTVEIDPERAPLVEWAFKSYASGDWTLSQLHEELTARGLTSLPTA